MLAMYLLSIVVAWLAAPRDRERGGRHEHLRLVVAVSMLDQLRRQERRSPAMPTSRWWEGQRGR